MSRTSRLLLVALAAAVALDVALRWPAPDPLREQLPAFTEDQVAAVRIHEGDEEWTLVRSGSAWILPSGQAADAERIGELLAGLSRGVPLDARVDVGNFEDYGLAGADPVRVDVLGPADQPISSLVVGFDAGGGATWVRRPGEDAVYRARIGGRGRYDRPLAGWRDRRILAFPALSAIRVERSDGAYALAAGEPWTLVGDPAFEVDPVLAREVGRVLSDWRALDVGPAEVAARAGPPHARVVLEAGDRAAVLRVWPSMVAVDGEDAVFRIAPAMASLLSAPAEAWRDHTVWVLDPAGLDELRLEEAERVILGRQPGGWAVLSPPGVRVDPARVAQVAQVLAAPRVEEWLPVSAAEAGFLGGSRVVVGAGADRRTLEIGAPVPGRPAGREAIYVRDPRRPERIGTWSAATWAGVRAGFGR